MACEEARRLQGDESKAWGEWNRLRETDPKAAKELSRHYEDACVASIQLREHLQSCPDCTSAKTSP